MADDYDFEIDTLKFRAAISDQFPYGRSTAQFRKEQVDQSAQVGDQSLTGWWTRGQLSFHRGAGLDFYEVLDGEEVLSRYASSYNVDPFTPGVVTVHEVVRAITLPETEIEDMIVFPQSGGLRFFLLTNTALYRTTHPDTAFTAVTLNGSVASSHSEWTSNGRDSLWLQTSAGIEHVSSAGTATTVYTAVPGSPVGMWYAKGRLWVLLSTGVLYAAPANTSGSVAFPTTVTFDLGVLGVNPWLTESPGAVYISNGLNKVFKLDVTDDTSATLDAPVVVALTPEKEISLIQFHMERLVLVMGEGIRVAAVNSDGSLTIGPLIDCSDGRFIGSVDSEMLRCTTVGASVYIARRASATKDLDVLRLNLEQPLEGQDLVYAFCEHVRSVNTNDAGGSLAGVQDAGSWGLLFYCQGSSGNGAAWTNDSGDNGTIGELTTAAHRFGTLELKNFHSITVRVTEGFFGGTITVKANGITVGTINGDTDTIATFPIGQTAESMDFTFTWGPDDEFEPIQLLGYQVKALPVPERQRILKWPLEIKDQIRLRRGSEVGREGKAYTDLTALEALESSDAVITFTDHRTGETGTAYIDQVEFQSDTPSTTTDNGFGGIAYVTLRVLS